MADYKVEYWQRVDTGTAPAEGNWVQVQLKDGSLVRIEIPSGHKPLITRPETPVAFEGFKLDPQSPPTTQVTNKKVKLQSNPSQWVDEEPGQTNVVATRADINNAPCEGNSGPGGFVIKDAMCYGYPAINNDWVPPGS